jgi:trans-aconitate 2-methyltransferase
MMNKKYLAALLLVVGPVAAMEKEVVVNPNSWDAEKYKANSSRQYAAAMNVLSRIKFNETDHVLDVGCGDGKITREIANRVPRGIVKGIDGSSNMVNAASKDYADVKNLLFEHANIVNYSSEHKFNYVFAFASFSWIKEQQEALINIANVLKPGGTFTSGIANEESPYLKVRYGIMKTDKWKDYFVDYEVPYYPSNEDKIKKLCENAGFTAVTVEKKATSYPMAREKVIGFMQALPVQIDKIPKERQEEFLNDIIDDYIKIVPQKEEGIIDLPISGLVLIAKK